MSDAAHNLYRETQAAQALLANLKDIIGEDTQFAADIVEGETHLHEAIDRAVQLLVDDTAAVTGLTQMIDGLTDRRERLQARIAIVRTALAIAMDQAGRKTYPHAAVTITLKAVPPSVMVTDEAAIPAQYFKPKDPVLDKRALLTDLKAKKTIPGCTLSNGGNTLQLKWG